MSRSKILVLALLLPLTGNQLSGQQPSAQLVFTLRGQTKSIQQIEFSHSGELIASGSKDGTVRLWRTATGESLTTITYDPKAELFKMSWSSDDRWLALTYREKRSWELAVWEVSTDRRATLSQRLPGLCFLDWSPDGHVFIAEDEQGNLGIWDAISKQLTQTISPRLPKLQPFRTSFVADGRRVLTASLDGPVQLWEVATGKLVGSYPRNTFTPGLTYPGPLPGVVSLNKRLLISDNVNIYETSTGRLLPSVHGGRNLVSISPDGKSVLAVSYTAATKLFQSSTSDLSIRRIDNGEELSTFQVPERIHSVIWSPNGKTLAIMGLNFHPRLIDVASGRENGRLPYGNCFPEKPFGSDGCEPIRFSADGKMLLKEKEPIKLWDAQTVSLITVLKAAHLPAVFSPTDDRLLATRSEDKKSVLVWRLQR